MVFGKLREFHSTFAKEHPGASTHGATLEAARKNLTEALEFALKADRFPCPKMQRLFNEYICISIFINIMRL